jgi:tripartite-type tricarboxylate transporter receptor subunit TctC
MSISKSRKSRAETPPIVSSSRRWRCRQVEAAILHGYPFRVNATKLRRRQFIHLAAGTVALPAFSHTATAQTYPSRPITMVVPFATGGAADVIARMVADRMRTSLRQPVIVENVSGAGGTIGVGRVVRATPDGYTLIIGNWNTHVANGALYSLQFDLLRDFEPISLISSNPWLIAAKKAFPAADLRGLIAWLKANPDKASAGTAGMVAENMSAAFCSKT